jgi:hypothetical protein
MQQNVLRGGNLKRLERKRGMYMRWQGIVVLDNSIRKRRLELR